MNNLRVLYLTNTPTPYRSVFLNELGNFCDLTVIFEHIIAENRDSTWSDRVNTSYKEVVLSHTESKTPSFKISKYLNKDKFDVFVFCGYTSMTSMFAIEYCSFKKIPFILSIDGGYAKNESTLKHRCKEHFISKASHWLSPSSVSDNYLIHYGATESRISRYPFTSILKHDIISKEEHHSLRKAARERLGFSDQQHVILTVGQFIERKGFDILVDAVGLIEDHPIDVVFVGGEPNKELLEIIEKHSNKHNFHFPGYFTKEELKNYFLASDVFVFPTREDIWGLVVNESMAYGLPIISSDASVAALELIAPDENGVIFASESVNELSQQLRRVLFNRELLELYSSNALSTIENHTLEEMALKHYNVFVEFFNKTHR